jgi:hypothetical protein
VIPDELVRVQLGRVAWKKVNLQATAAFLHELRYQFGSVRGVTIDDQKYASLSAAEKAFQELTKA